MSILLSHATPADIDSLFDVSLAAHNETYYSLIAPAQRALFDEHYSDTPDNRAKFADNIRPFFDGDSPAPVVVARESKTGRIVGYTYFDRRAEKNVLLSLFVHPEQQGQGIGKLLFNESLKGVDATLPTYLYVLEKNARAIAMYTKYGFVQTRQIAKKYYGAQQIEMLLKHIDK